MLYVILLFKDYTLLSSAGTFSSDSCSIATNTENFNHKSLHLNKNQSATTKTKSFRNAFKMLIVKVN